MSIVKTVSPFAYNNQLFRFSKLFWTFKKLLLQTMILLYLRNYLQFSIYITLYLFGITVPRGPNSRFIFESTSLKLFQIFSITPSLPKNTKKWSSSKTLRSIQCRSTTWSLSSARSTWATSRKAKSLDWARLLVLSRSSVDVCKCRNVWPDRLPSPSTVPSSHSPFYQMFFHIIYSCWFYRSREAFGSGRYDGMHVSNCCNFFPRWRNQLSSQYWLSWITVLYRYYFPPHSCIWSIGTCAWLCEVFRRLTPRLSPVLSWATFVMILKLERNSCTSSRINFVYVKKINFPHSCSGLYFSPALLSVVKLFR